MKQDFTFFKKAKKILRPPDMGDDEKNRNARFMYIFLFAGMIIAAIVNYITEINNQKIEQIISTITLFMLTVSFILLNLKKVKLSAYVTIGTLLIVFIITLCML